MRCEYQYYCCKVDFRCIRVSRSEAKIFFAAVIVIILKMSQLSVLDELGYLLFPLIRLLQFHFALTIEKIMILNIYAVMRFCVLLGVSLLARTIAHFSNPNYVTGLSASSSQLSSSHAVKRRTFMSQLRFGVVGVATSTAITPAMIPSLASAYERRDVGGPDASPETKAMNLQAYETNNRLEREGVKLEVTQNM
jgi:hypothetical protein